MADWPISRPWSTITLNSMGSPCDWRKRIFFLLVERYFTRRTGRWRRGLFVKCRPYRAGEGEVFSGAVHSPVEPCPGPGRAGRTVEQGIRDNRMRTSGFLVLLGWALSASGQDAQRGRLLYETHRVACHYLRRFISFHSRGSIDGPPLIRQ